MKYLLCSLFLTLALSVTPYAPDAGTPFGCLDEYSFDLPYFEKFYRYAQDQQNKYGVPASVTLAQGKVESASGQSRVAKRLNNHFGVRRGKKYRVYETVLESFEHHSKVLTEKRYKDCKGLPVDTYCDCIARKGYAEAGNYAHVLKWTIEFYNLKQFDL
jgi:flagellum-specific peptidoglycan hydrolase FlgJ